MPLDELVKPVAQGLKTMVSCAIVNPLEDRLGHVVEPADQHGGPVPVVLFNHRHGLLKIRGRGCQHDGEARAVLIDVAVPDVLKSRVVGKKLYAKLIKIQVRDA